MFLEFPINHVNINSEIRRWQIETGPILFPIINKEKKSYEYLPSFVHFNDLNISSLRTGEIDLLDAGPAKSKKVDHHSFGIIFGWLGICCCYAVVLLAFLCRFCLLFVVCYIIYIYIYIHICIYVYSYDTLFRPV